MLRFRATAFALVLVLAPAFLHPQRFTRVVKGGVSNSAFEGLTIIGESFDSISRMTGGAGFGYDFGNGFMVHAEVLYVIKGGEGNSLLETTPIQGTFDLAYVEVPLLLTYRLERFRSIYPMAFIGPSLSFNQDATVTFQARGGSIEDSNPIDLADDQDRGLVFGVGIEVPVNVTRLTFEIRSTRSFTNLREEGLNRTLENRAVLFLAGIRF